MGSLSVQNWTPIEARVEDVTPYPEGHVQDTLDILSTRPDLDDNSEWKAQQNARKWLKDNPAFKAGDVIWVKFPGYEAALCLVHNQTFEMKDDGYWWQCFRVSKARKDGLFGRVLRVAYPGYIERGYKEAEEKADA